MTNLLKICFLFLLILSIHGNVFATDNHFYGSNIQRLSSHNRSVLLKENVIIEKEIPLLDTVIISPNIQYLNVIPQDRIVEVRKIERIIVPDKVLQEVEYVDPYVQRLVVPSVEKIVVDRIVNEVKVVEKIQKYRSYCRSH